MDAQRTYFPYGQEEIQYLKQKDMLLGDAIDQIGIIHREVHPDLFASLVSSIIGQQISTKAQITIWKRLQDSLPDITPGTIAACSAEEIQSCGITMRKAGYIQKIAQELLSGHFDLTQLAQCPAEEVCRRLSTLPGVGVWTAEMLMIFSMCRPDILSFGDLAIQRGLRMLYHHRKITDKLYLRYKRRYSPYGSVASLYLWEIASGKYGYKDYAPKSKK